MSSTQLIQKGDEPSMYLQRPSSARSQDVAHILARTFRDQFLRDSISPEVVKNLTVSRGGEDEYHERFVALLQNVQEERDRRMAEAAMLERHIMQAQARAMSADERELNRITSGQSQFPDLGLPPDGSVQEKKSNKAFQMPVRSHFRSCIDSELLKKHNLISPEDFAPEEAVSVPAPQWPGTPNYAKQTATSQKHRSRETDPGTYSPLLSAGSLDSQIMDSISDDEDAAEIQQLMDTRGSDTQRQQNLWKSQMYPEHRETDRKHLANLQDRVAFLKNPRHIPPSACSMAGRTLIKQYKKKPKEVGIKPKPEKQTETTEHNVIFVASPPLVKFTEYEVGQVYELTLELKNVTTVLRPVRVIPPKSSFFSVGLGQFPGEHGLVAPGMSCYYTVRFAPDSQGDFDDCLKIQTQSSETLLIPLQGHRQPPVLTLPDTLDVGHCLVGGVKVCQFIVRNDGGPGRFCMIPRKLWPATNFKTIVSPGCVSMMPFEVRPAVFELAQGQCCPIEVVFYPHAISTYTQNLTMVCDNCQVQHFTITGEGQYAGVDFVSIAGGTAEPLPDEINDVSAHKLVRFENLNPFTYVQKPMVLTNTTHVDLPFQWVVVKPCLEPPDPDRTEVTIPTHRVADADSAFSIDPPSGMLSANTTATFLVTYAPPEVNKYHSVLHMVLKDVPDERAHTLLEASAQDPDARPQIQRSKSSLPDSFTPPKSITLKDMTALEVEVKAECEAFKVMLQPYAVCIPGQTLIGNTVRKHFMILNSSISSIWFEWEKKSNSHIIEVEPPGGELGPGLAMEMILIVTGTCRGKLDETLRCRVEHLPEPVCLHIEADIRGPEVVIDEAEVNFGLVRLGELRSSVIKVHNTTQIEAEWSLEESAEHLKSDDNQVKDSQFAFNPSWGVLKPLESKEVSVSFMATHCQSVNTVYHLKTKNGNESFISARGEVQNPQVCLLSCELVMKDIFLDVPTCHKVSLLNQTLLDTQFEWGEPEGADTEACTVSISPRCGRLEGRQQLELEVSFTAHKQGEFGDLRLPCWVAGMDSPLYLALFTIVRGLSVTYSAGRHGEEKKVGFDLLLDFGKNVCLGSTPKCFLYIKNNSAITAPFNVSMESYSAKPPTPPEKKIELMATAKSQRRSLLGKTPNLADPLSKTTRKANTDLSAAMLHAGKGAAFIANPASGVLTPFGEQVIEVTGYSDMWGSYTDRLICKVDQLDTVYIPMSLDVSGCPLQFQMTAASPEQRAILRFGTHVSGVKPVIRQMRINNSSPFDIRTDWEVLNVVPGDPQLVDFMVSFGEAFPLKDASGNEIVPKPADDSSEKEKIVPAKIKRLPTNMLPDSPDSTPAISRQVTEANKNNHQEAPQFASVMLRAHEGQRADVPYRIIPSQMVIPGKSSKLLTVQFSTEGAGGCTDPSGYECNSFALGYMSLNDKALADDSVKRVDGYSVAPLRLDMTAHIKPALLNIECIDDEGMCYRSAASDLMADGQLENENNEYCSATLCNNTQTPLTFYMKTESPFHVVSAEPRKYGTPGVRLDDMNWFTLKPGQNIMVKVAFRTTSNLLTFVDEVEEGGSRENGEGRVRLEAHGMERKLYFSNDLNVHFNNGTSQTLALHASLTIPSLRISQTELDFGTCLVGQKRELQITLTNKTGSVSYWTVVCENSSDTVDENTFQVSPSSGSLDAYITHVSNSKTTVHIFFTAKHNEDYEAVYVFHGMLGEEAQRLHVKGQGSYDGKHEAVVNI